MKPLQVRDRAFDDIPHPLSPVLGLMSFMTYYLIKNPETMRKLQAEVDEVLGGQPVQYQDLSKMPYLTGKS